MTQDIAENSPVLRVLSGRQAGAEKILPAAGSVSIGYQFWQNVVIREPAVRDIALDFTLDAEGARLTVLSGEAKLLGSTLHPGETALLPPYVPFAIGGIALAWGEASSVRWSEAGTLAAAVPVPPPPPPTIEDKALALLSKAADRAGDLLTGWRLPALAGAGALLIGATAAGPALEAMGFHRDRAGRVETALTKAGLAELRATSNVTTGAVIVSGVVGSEEERLRAERVLRTTYVPTQLNVQTSQDLAQAAADVARIRGLQASARPIGRADIELHTPPLAPDARAQLVEAVKADVGEVRRLVLEDDLPPQDNAPVKTVNDATKKVSTVVAGDPGYIKTVDGALYFPGAMMPSGHRLVGIEGQTVLLEKDGRETRLTF